MRQHSNVGGGNAVYNLYNEIADNYWNLTEIVKTLPPDKIVYFIMHEDKNDFGDIKPKTIGKLIDDKVNLEDRQVEVKDLTLDDLYNLYEKQKMISLVKIINGSIKLFLEKED